MITQLNFGRVSTCLLALCVLLVSACGGSPPDAYVSGSRQLPSAEYATTYAGKSVRMYADHDGYFEWYFGKDGSVQGVAPEYSTILEGTWEVAPGLAGSGNFNLIIAFSGIENGKAFRSGKGLATMYVYELPDGTASVFTRYPDGTSITRQSKPTSGFPGRALFNSIKRKVASELG